MHTPSNQRPFVPASLLAQCRPLRDPVRAWSLAMRFGIALVALTYLFAFLFGTGGPESLIVKGVGSLVGVAMMAPFLVVFRPKPRQAILVRKFVNDIGGGHLYAAIAAGLGPSFRVCGIRSPIERVSLWFRLLLWSHAAVRYVGSHYQQLEAEDNDWLGRLLSTLRKTDVAIIDLRDATDYVLTEAKVCLAALGLSRCLLLVDDSGPERAWRGVLGVNPAEPGELRAVAVPLASDEYDRFVVDVRRFASSLPVKPPRGMMAALEIARATMTDADFRTPLLRTDAGLFVASFVLTACLGFLAGRALALAGVGPTSRFFIILGAVMGPLYLFLGAALLRLWRASGPRFEAAARARAAQRRRLTALTLMTLMSMACFALLLAAPSALERARARAKEVLQSARLHQLSNLAMLYIYQNPDVRRRISVGFLSEELIASVREAGLLEDVTLAEADVWGRPLLFRREPDGRSAVVSSGADGMPDTADDIVLTEDGYVRRRDEMATGSALK